jgi:hypothetical protein
VSIESPATRERSADMTRWAIRNCGLILLRAVIDCGFGTGDSKAELEAGWDGKTTKISYAKYPDLPLAVLEMLQTGQRATSVESQRRSAESVFPALEIIRRGGPPDSLRAELFESVTGYLGSHLWHVRELAARTTTSFLVSEDWSNGLVSLLHLAKGNNNRLHGTLMAAKYLLERNGEISSKDFSGMIPRDYRWAFAWSNRTEQKR